MVCAKCGGQNPASAKFCRKCGSPIVKAAPAPAVRPAPDRASNVCPNCGSANSAGAKFCSSCGGKLSVLVTPPQAERAVQPAAPSPVPKTAPPPLVVTASIPLFAVPVDKSEESIRVMAGAAKVRLFGLEGKRTYVGKKPEEYIKLESADWVERVYVRVHSVYSFTFAVDRVYPLAVGKNTVEAEIEGPGKLPVEGGALNLRVKLRDVVKGDNTTYFDSSGEEVSIQLPPKAQLKPLRTVHPPLTPQSVETLLDTVLKWEEKRVKERLGEALAQGGVKEREDVDLSDHEVVVAPYFVLAYQDTKTGERRRMSYDPLQGKLMAGVPERK